MYLLLQGNNASTKVIQKFEDFQRSFERVHF
jgi:hypothetical protein